MGKKQFCFFQTAETGNRTPDSGVKGSGANHYPRAPAQLAKKHYYFSNLQKCKGDIKQSWSTINQLLCKKGEKTSIPDFFKIDGNIITGKKKYS